MSISPPPRSIPTPSASAHLIHLHRYQFYQKIAYIAVMIRRMLYAVLDPACIDDRDYYGNKRLELAGGDGRYFVRTAAARDEVAARLWDFHWLDGFPRRWFS